MRLSVCRVSCVCNATVCLSLHFSYLPQYPLCLTLIGKSFTQALFFITHSLMYEIPSLPHTISTVSGQSLSDWHAHFGLPFPPTTHCLLSGQRTFQQGSAEDIFIIWKYFRNINYQLMEDQKTCGLTTGSPRFALTITLTSCTLNKHSSIIIIKVISYHILLSFLQSHHFPWRMRQLLSDSYWCRYRRHFHIRGLELLYILWRQCRHISVIHLPSRIENASYIWLLHKHLGRKK
jgi:hypothetical protein